MVGLFCKSRVFDQPRLVNASICRIQRPTRHPTERPLLCTILDENALTIVLVSRSHLWCALMTRQRPRTLPWRDRDRQVKHPSCIFHKNEANRSLGANPRLINTDRPSDLALLAPIPKPTLLPATEDIVSRAGVRPTGSFMTPEEKITSREGRKAIISTLFEQTPMPPKLTPMPRFQSQIPIHIPRLPEQTPRLPEQTPKPKPPKQTPKETYDATGATQINRLSRAIEGVSSAEAKRNAITARRKKYIYSYDNVNHSPDIGNPDHIRSPNATTPTVRPLSITNPSAQTPTVAERMYPTMK
jgi:hypothetical protein